MAPGNEFARDLCAGIGPLQLGVVLVFKWFIHLCHWISLRSCNRVREQMSVIDLFTSDTGTAKWTISSQWVPDINQSPVTKVPRLRYMGTTERQSTGHRWTSVSSECWCECHLIYCHVNVIWHIVMWMSSGMLSCECHLTCFHVNVIWHVVM